MTSLNATLASFNVQSNGDLCGSALSFYNAMTRLGSGFLYTGSNYVLNNAATCSNSLQSQVTVLQKISAAWNNPLGAAVFGTWVGTDFCSSTAPWAGVQCTSQRPGGVASLSLPGLGISGDALGSLLGQLGTLTALSLASNSLTSS